MTYARIGGTGSYLPEKILTNKEIESFVDTSDQWIHERTGIRQRHIVADGESTCDLAERAARSALESAGRDAAEVDLVVVGTTTPDKIYPATACRLQSRLGIGDCPAFDVQAVCTGFIYAVGIAEKFIKTGAAKTALVVGADTHSRLLDWSDRGTCVLFGDGAGAVILEASETPGIYSTQPPARPRSKMPDFRHTPAPNTRPSCVPREFSAGDPRRPPRSARWRRRRLASPVASAGSG